LENPDFEEGTAIGVVRHVVIADTMDEAVAASAPAYNHWYASLTKLERDNVAGPRIATSMFEDVNEAIDKGLVIVGPPDTVRDALKDQFGRLDANYYILGFFFGTLPVENALRSLDLFATEIMPELSAL
jgi:alkanesulfonate monooxygenase SsuD/methylene tetrahydromethanopterin reductase-like flavin-dependent oxidoreductase (luciferase family)